ncbi:hypothetical protein Celaphus_00011815, partial [Cervus elaphus hippelaphus]
MGRTREAGCVAAGVVIGAGACYCVYRLTWGRDNEIIWNEDDDEEEESRDISETGKGAKANAGAGAGARLQGDSKAKAEVAVELKSGPDVKAEAHSKAESGGGLEAKAKALFSTLKEQASAKASKAAKLGTIFGTRALAPGLPCPGVRGGGCHPVRNGARAGSKANFFALLFLGNYFTKIQIMKLIINFTENPAMTRELVSCKVPSELISLFNKEWDREILLNILTLFENINDNIKNEGLASSRKEFSRSSLFFLFKESGVCVKKIKALANHSDLVVKVKVLKRVPASSEFNQTRSRGSWVHAPVLRLSPEAHVIKRCPGPVMEKGQRKPYGPRRGSGGWQTAWALPGPPPPPASPPWPVATLVKVLDGGGLHFGTTPWPPLSELLALKLGIRRDQALQMPIASCYLQGFPALVKDER